MTVRKDGPNQGRQFYSCGNERTCNFFEWADNPSSSNAATTRQEPRNNNPPPSSNQSDGGTKCRCNQQAPLLTVRKEGPNSGRQFYGCPERKCGFFEWADDLGLNSTSNSSRPSKSSGRKPPTCSKCGQSGHTKRGCKN